MEVAILAHGEDLPECPLGHLDDGFLDGDEFTLNVLVVFWQVAERSKHSDSFGFATLQDEPTWGFWQRQNKRQDDEGEEDLEGNRKSPGDGAWCEGQAEVDPIAVVMSVSRPSKDRGPDLRYHDAACNEGSLYHDHLPSAMRFRCF